MLAQRAGRHGRSGCAHRRRPRSCSWRWSGSPRRTRSGPPRSSCSRRDRIISRRGFLSQGRAPRSPSSGSTRSSSTRGCSSASSARATSRSSRRASGARETFSDVRRPSHRAEGDLRADGEPTRTASSTGCGHRAPEAAAARTDAPSPAGDADTAEQIEKLAELHHAASSPTRSSRQEDRAARPHVTRDAVRVVSLVPSVTETLLAWGIVPVGLHPVLRATRPAARRRDEEPRRRCHRGAAPDAGGDVRRGEPARGRRRAGGGRPGGALLLAPVGGRGRAGAGALAERSGPSGWRRTGRPTPGRPCRRSGCGRSCRSGAGRG